MTAGGGGSIGRISSLLANRPNRSSSAAGEKLLSVRILWGSGAICWRILEGRWTVGGAVWLAALESLSEYRGGGSAVPAEGNNE